MATLGRRDESALRKVIWRITAKRGDFYAEERYTIILLWGRPASEAAAVMVSTQKIGPPILCMGGPIHNPDGAILPYLTRGNQQADFAQDCPLRLLRRKRFLGLLEPPLVLIAVARIALGVDAACSVTVQNPPSGLVLQAPPCRRLLFVPLLVITTIALDHVDIAIGVTVQAACIETTVREESPRPVAPLLFFPPFGILIALNRLNVSILNDKIPAGCRILPAHRIAAVVCGRCAARRRDDDNGYGRSNSQQLRRSDLSHFQTPISSCTHHTWSMSVMYQTGILEGICQWHLQDHWRA